MITLPPAVALRRPAGTITNAAKVLHAEGAREVYACATHAVFSPPAVERLSRWAAPCPSAAGGGMGAL